MGEEVKAEEEEKEKRNRKEGKDEQEIGYYKSGINTNGTYSL